MDLSRASFDAILCPVMLRRPTIKVSLPIITFICALFPFISFPRSLAAQTTSNDIHVELVPIEVDPKRPERKNFGALTLLSAFHLQSKDKRFGGLSGLSIGKDGKLYAVSDRGYWLSASTVTDKNGALTNLIDWQIAPMLTPTKTPVTGRLRDAEALAQTRDGSFLVGFEGAHRIWRYSAPPNTFASTPIAVTIPSAVARAPGNGGIEGLAMLPD
ncbi:MAG: esterase-like activity of phytase family protein, partial [Candidatus Binatia bacterium]